MSTLLPKQKCPLYVDKNYGKVESVVLRKAVEKTVLAHTAIAQHSWLSREDCLKAICHYGLSPEYVKKLSDAQVGARNAKKSHTGRVGSRSEFLFASNAIHLGDAHSFETQITTVALWCAA